MATHHSKSLRILQVIPRFSMGGVEQGALDLGSFLYKQGHVPYIMTAGGTKIPQAEKQNIHILLRPVDKKNPLSLAKNGYDLFTFCRKESIDLVHVRSRAPAWSALWATRQLGIPLVTTFHGVYNFPSHSLGVMKKYYNSVMARGNHVIAVSQFIHDHLLTHYSHWISPQNLSIIHRGIDHRYFDPTNISLEATQHLRKSWNIPGDEPLLLMPARLTRWKGQSHVIRMLAHLSRGTVVFLGSHQGRQAYLQELQNLASQLNVIHRVRFFADAPCMPTAYKAADMVLHASTDPEAFGRVIAEAQAMGKPVIVSPHGAGREIILANQTGWLVDPVDAKGLAKRCEEILEMDAGLRQKLAGTARQRMVSLFTSDGMAQKTLAVYQNLLRS